MNVKNETQYYTDSGRKLGQQTNDLDQLTWLQVGLGNSFSIVFCPMHKQ